MRPNLFNEYAFEMCEKSCTFSITLRNVVPVFSREYLRFGYFLNKITIKQVVFHASDQSLNRFTEYITISLIKHACVKIRVLKESNV